MATHKLIQLSNLVIILHHLPFKISPLVIYIHTYLPIMHLPINNDIIISKLPIYTPPSVSGNVLPLLTAPFVIFFQDVALFHQ